MLLFGLLLSLAISVVLTKYVPVVLMHGLGDTANSEGMLSLKQDIMDSYPGIYVYSIQIGKTEKDDHLATVYDDLNRQVEEICSLLSSNDVLSDGFDAVGFSQGGQILRAYVQRCNNPPVRNLITIGAQHQGIMDLPGCVPDEPQPEDDREVVRDLQLAQAFFSPEPEEMMTGGCGWWQRMIKKNIYSDFAQQHIVQAQYFKDPARFEEYLAKNIFLADINNEREVKRPEYAERLSSLESFVMYMFIKDTQLIPRETSVFGYFDGKQLQDLTDQPIYKEDWIGLKALNEEGRLHRLTIPTEHMRLSQEFILMELLPRLGN